MKDEIISVIDKDIEIAEGLYSKDIVLPVVVFILFLIILQNLSYSILAAAVIFIFLQKAKKEMRTIDRVYKMIRYALRPPNYTYRKV